MDWFEWLSRGIPSGSVPIVSCVSESPVSCECEHGRVNARGHLICACGHDHGEYAGPNDRKPFFR